MTKRITRRQFLQMGGLAGTAVALSGCTIDLQKPEYLQPYVVPPEEALPGQTSGTPAPAASVPPVAASSYGSATDGRTRSKAIRCIR